MDAVGGDIAEHYGRDSSQANCSEYTEETLEDLGQLLFIYALLDYIRRHIGSIQVTVQ